MSKQNIKGLFDNVNQEWLLKFLAHRIGDKRIQRMVKRILKAGVAEDGSVTISDDGNPQGGLCEALHKPPYAKKSIMQSKATNANRTSSSHPIYFA